jgi:4-hydroxymandelate oxidase
MQATCRREFLKFILGSPLFAQQGPSVITDPKDALSVMDFEEAARKALPPAHFGYMATGVDDDLTLRANREGYGRIQLRARRLSGVVATDLKTTLFGTTWSSPIAIAPCGNQKAFHPQGELEVARAVKSKHALMLLSTATNISVEDISKTVGGPIWYQLYATNKWEITQRLVHRAEAAGCPALALTVDTNAGRNTETLSRSRKMDSRQCTVCHPTTPGSFYRRKPMFDGFDPVGVSTANPGMNWEFVRKLKSLSQMKLLIKGIGTREDALLCLENGVDGIIVSNHGGRAEESGRGTIECLPEVVDAVGGRIPVLIDGGIRRGTDVFKALALGANAVCIGRPYLWGLGAFGQPGVERILDILRRETDLVMRQCGAAAIAEIKRSMITIR